MEYRSRYCSVEETAQCDWTWKKPYLFERGFAIFFSLLQKKMLLIFLTLLCYLCLGSGPGAWSGIVLHKVKVCRRCKAYISIKDMQEKALVDMTEKLEQAKEIGNMDAMKDDIAEAYDRRMRVYKYNY